MTLGGLNLVLVLGMYHRNGADYDDQGVKYQAVLEARQTANGQPQNVRTILALGGELPDELLPLKNILGIEVYEKVIAN